MPDIAPPHGLEPRPRIERYRSRHGSIAHYASDDVIGLSLREFGEWAESEISLLRPYIQPGATILDVGANVGTHTLAFARLTGPSGTVIAFEAQPDIHTLLSRNIVENDLAAFVHAVPAIVGAVSKLASYAPVADTRQNTGATSFAGLAADPEAGSADSGGALRHPLAMVSIDDLGLQGCNLIKIDAEGMEPQVFDGATATLARFKPVIYFEFASGDLVSLGTMHALLHEHGYRLFWHYANPFNRNNLHGETLNWFGGAVELNVLALPPGIDPPQDLVSMAEPGPPPTRPTLEEAKTGEWIDDYLKPVYPSKRVQPPAPLPQTGLIERLRAAFAGT